MTKEEIKIYEPDLGLNGTIPQLVDWANRYTDDYSDQALEKISELARLHGFGDKEVEIPILLRVERLKEGNGTLESAYARLKIDHLLGFKISLSISNYGKDGTELEIYEDQGKVVISLYGIDDEGGWSACNVFTINEFMGGATNWLDVAIGQILSYGKLHDTIGNAS